MSGDYMQGDKDSAVAVPFSDDEAAEPASEVLEEDKPTDSPEERITRKKRRQERLNRLISEGKQSKEELASVKAELERLKGEQAAIQRQVASATQRPANDTARPDPYEQQLDAVYARQAEAYTAAQAEVKAGTFTPERQQHYEKLARTLESEKTRLHAQRLIDEQAQQRRTESARQVWVQKYPEVYQDPRAFQYAQATYQQRMALGEADSRQLVDEVMTEAMARFRLGAKPAPTASERSRLSGVPAAGSSGSSKASGIVMNPAFERMAKAAYPDLPETEAVKRWVNGPGKRLREKKVI